MIRFQTVIMLAILSWWFVLQLFALAALPLAWRLFARLPGRGYPLAKALGLLLVAYVLWLGATLHLLPNSFGGAVVALIVVVGASWWLGRDGWRRDADGVRPLAAWMKANRWLVLTTELLFLFVLVGWVAIRAYNPDIAGTEKPMEFAFVNGILRSPLFPPQDPWLSGYGISYYYFGYVMLAALVNLTGVDPAIAFNLGVALWYALVMLGAFGVVYDLVRLAGIRDQGPGTRDQGTRDDALQYGSRNTQYAFRYTDTPARGIRYGLLGALFVGFLGNLEGLVELAYHKSLVPLQWLQWLDIKQLTDNPPSGNLTGGFWWWWHASRVIHDKDLLGNSIEVIDEFPFFSFLLGDMHPHVLALPFAILAVALALNLLLGARSWAARSAGVQADRGEDGASATGIGSRTTHHASQLWQMLGDATNLGTPGILLYAIALGALAFLNTWDFPIYVGLVMLALGVGWALADRLSWAVVGRAVAGGIVLAVLGWLLHLPFYLGFQSQLGGILPNLLFPSRFSQFVVMFGLFILVIVFFLALLTRELPGRRVLRGFLVAVPFTLLVPALLLAAVALGMAVMPRGKAFVQEVLNNPAVQANVGSPTLGGLVGLRRADAAGDALDLAGAGRPDRLGGRRVVGGVVGTQRHGDGETRRHGDGETRRHGDCETRRDDPSVPESPRLPVSGSFRRAHDRSRAAAYARSRVRLPARYVRDAHEYGVQVLLSGLAVAGAGVGVRRQPVGRARGRAVAQVAGVDPDWFACSGKPLVSAGRHPQQGR